jgi:predicted dehydrogenase
MTEPLRWGVIGTGGIARAFAAELADTTSGDVVAVGSRSRAGAEAFGDALGVARRHGSYEALVADEAVQAVYVATPHPMHHANTRLVLEARKPVLVEKPFTMNAAEARDLVELARASGVLLMEAMPTRFMPHLVEVRRLVSEGALGEIATVLADHGQFFEEDPAHRLFAAELGGGALLDLGVYVVSFASMFLGTPDRILALVDPAFTGVDGQTSMLLGHPGGAHAVLTCTSAAISPKRAAIVGTEGRIEVDPPFLVPGGFTLFPREGEPRRVEPADRGRLRHEADEVARCLREGLLESPKMPLDETIAVMETMDAVLAQAQEAAVG